MKKSLLAMLSASLLLACGDDDEGERIDAGTDDASVPLDGGDVVDGAVLDGDLIDGDVIDGGLIDAGTPDAEPDFDAGAGACTPASLSLARQPLAGGFDFGVITDLKSPPGDARLFVASKDGPIYIIDGDEVLEQPFLELDVATDRERGLLGLAFDPAYARNRRFFVFYTPPGGKITVAEGRARADNPDLAEATLVPLLSETHSSNSENGGWLDFGPDGYLYVATGDNAEGSVTAQNKSSLFGKILRLDVSTPGDYAIPRDNPFAAGGGRGEVWAYGLRNPWRASFDRLTGDLYIADVGKNTMEEVNVQPADSPGGENYGWAVMEGTYCDSCNPAGFTLPVHEYLHVGPSSAIMGGYVYRGSALPECAGTYFFADYETHAVGSFRWPAGPIQDLTPAWSGLSAAGSAITSFGLDRDGELLMGDLGRVYRVIRGN